MRIMVIDDSSTMRKVQRKVLGSLGYEDIIEAEDGVDAIKKMKEVEFKIDLILCDWNMPNMDGLTLLKKLQGVEALKSIPIVMVTTEAEKARIIEAIKAGAKQYIIKPFTPDSMKEKLKPFLK